MNWNDDDDDCSSWHVKEVWCIVQDPQQLHAATAALLRTPWPAASVCLEQHGFYGLQTPAGSDEDCWEDHQGSTALSVEHLQNPQENCRHSQGTPPPWGTVRISSLQTSLVLHQAHKQADRSLSAWLPHTTISLFTLTVCKYSCCCTTLFTRTPCKCCF